MARSTKRRTKHRGNAAGIVEARGKTHKGGSGSTKAARTRRSAFEREPSWRSAFLRALVAAVIFVAVMLFLGREQSPVVTVVVGVALVGVYTPFGYYVDRFFYRRRLAKAAREREARRAAKG